MYRSRYRGCTSPLQVSRFSPWKLEERRRLKPGGRLGTRQEQLDRSLQQQYSFWVWRLLSRLGEGVWDVVVVGGSLGAARTALHLASRGLTVALLDSGERPRTEWSHCSTAAQGTSTLGWRVVGCRLGTWSHGTG